MRNKIINGTLRTLMWTFSGAVWLWGVISFGELIDAAFPTDDYPEDKE